MHSLRSCKMQMLSHLSKLIWCCWNVYNIQGARCKTGFDRENEKSRKIRTVWFIHSTIFIIRVEQNVPIVACNTFPPSVFIRICSQHFTRLHKCIPNNFTIYLFEPFRKWLVFSDLVAHILRQMSLAFRCISFKFHNEQNFTYCRCLSLFLTIQRSIWEFNERQNEHIICVKYQIKKRLIPCYIWKILKILNIKTEIEYFAWIFGSLDRNSVVNLK